MDHSSCRLLLVAWALSGCRSDNGLGDAPPPPPPPPEDTTDTACVPTTNDGDLEVPIATAANWSASSGELPDRACNLWVLDDTSEPEDPVLMSNSELDLGNDADGELLGYHQFADVLDFPDLVVFEASLHTVVDDEPGVQQAQMSIQFGDTNRKAVLVIAPDVIFVRANDTTRGNAYYDDTTHSSSRLKIQVDTTSQAVTVYRNDSLILSGTTYPATAPVEDELSWGELATNSHGTTHWSRVSHNALRPTACPPDPCAR